MKLEVLPDATEENKNFVKKEIKSATGRFFHMVSGFSYSAKTTGHVIVDTNFRVTPSFKVHCNRENGHYRGVGELFSAHHEASASASEKVELLSSSVNEYHQKIFSLVKKDPNLAASLKGKLMPFQPSYKAFSVATCNKCSGTCKNSCSTCNERGNVSCGRCKGSGKVQESYTNFTEQWCINCGYDGMVSRSVLKQSHQGGPTHYVMIKEVCPLCIGSGRLGYKGRYEKAYRTVKCGGCGGNGRYRCGTCSGNGYVNCTQCEGEGRHSTVLSISASYAVECESSIFNQDGDDIKMEVSSREAYINNTKIEPCKRIYSYIGQEDKFATTLDRRIHCLTTVSVERPDDSNVDIQIIGGKKGGRFNPVCKEPLLDKALSQLLRNDSDTLDKAVKSVEDINKLPALLGTSTLPMLSLSFTSTVNSMRTNLKDKALKSAISLRRKRIIPTALVIFLILALLLSHFPFSINVIDYMREDEFAYIGIIFGFVVWSASVSIYKKGVIAPKFQVSKNKKISPKSAAGPLLVGLLGTCCFLPESYVGTLCFKMFPYAFSFSLSMLLSFAINGNYAYKKYSQVVNKYKL